MLVLGVGEVREQALCGGVRLRAEGRWWTRGVVVIETEEKVVVMEQVAGGSRVRLPPADEILGSSRRRSRSRLPADELVATARESVEDAAALGRAAAGRRVVHVAAPTHQLDAPLHQRRRRLPVGHGERRLQRAEALHAHDAAVRPHLAWSKAEGPSARGA